MWPQIHMGLFSSRAYLLVAACRLEDLPLTHTVGDHVFRALSVVCCIPQCTKPEEGKHCQENCKNEEVHLQHYPLL